MENLDHTLYPWRQEHTEIPEYTFPVNIFHIYFPDRSIIPPHWHRHLEWILITKGRFFVQVGSESKELNAGEAALICGPKIHAAYPVEEGSELYAIVFNEALLHGIHDYTEAQYIRPLLSGKVVLPAFYTADAQITTPIKESIERMIFSYQERHRGYELRLKGELLSSLGHAFQLDEIKPVQKRTGQPEKGIHLLLVHLSTNFHKQITLEEAARICCVTPNYFCTLFKKTTGKTLIEYMNMLRIHEAGHLLQFHCYSIQDVAYQVGYSNLTYFGRVFKKFTGTSPSEYMMRFPVK